MDALRRAGSEIVSDGGDVQPCEVHWFQPNLELLWIPHGAKRVKSKCAPRSVHYEIQLREGGRKQVELSPGIVSISTLSHLRDNNRHHQDSLR